MLSFQQEREIIEYSNRVFNYFNGKINRVVPAKLNIRNNLDKNILAQNVFNIINLYLYNIISYYKDINEIKLNIIITIVHELSHIEQDVDSLKYIRNDEYCRLIENQNNYNTYRYLYHNHVDISNSLNIILDLELGYIYNNYIYYSEYGQYQSIDLCNYYKKCIKLISVHNSDKNIQLQIDKIFNSDNISFVFNNLRLDLKQNGILNNNVNQFNNAIELCNNYNISADINIVFAHDTHFIICTIVKGYTFNIE